MKSIINQTDGLVDWDTRWHLERHWQVIQGFCFREEEEVLENLPKTSVLFGDLVRTKEDEIVAFTFHLLTSRRLEEETESLITSIVSSSFSWGTPSCPGSSSSNVHLLLPTDVTLPPLPPIFINLRRYCGLIIRIVGSFPLVALLGTARRIVVLQRIKDQEDKADTQRHPFKKCAWVVGVLLLLIPHIEVVECPLRVIGGFMLLLQSQRSPWHPQKQTQVRERNHSSKVRKQSHPPQTPLIGDSRRPPTGNNPLGSLFPVFLLFPEIN